MLNDKNYNFTDKELNISYWYVTHKLLLKNIITIFFILICFLLWFYLIWQLVFLGIYYSIEQYQVRKLIFNDNLAISAIDQLKPATLQISDPVALPTSDNRKDYFIEISNNNKNWLATFDYGFNGNVKSSSIYQGFSLPLEKKYLINLGLEGSASELSVSNLKWRRIYDAKKIYEDRYKFKIENEAFVVGAKADDPSILVFDITNNSAFNYWQVGVQAFLYGSGDIASVNYLALDQLKAGEKRHVQINWTGNLPRISGIQIIPEINVFDDDNIMPQSAETDFPISL